MDDEERRARQALWQRRSKAKKRKKLGLPYVRQNTREQSGTAKEWLARQTLAVRSVFKAVKEDEGSTGKRPPLTHEQAQTLHDWVDQVVMDSDDLTYEEAQRWFDRTLMEEEYMSRDTDKVFVFKRSDGRFDWHRKDVQGRVLSTSGSQGYENHADALEMATEVNSDLPVEHFEEEE